MKQQMGDLTTAAELLPEGRSAELDTQIEALNEQLDLAVQGQAESGWPNADVVETVGSMCGEDELITWTVQP